jgi:hypothetical protein
VDSVPRMRSRVTPACRSLVVRERQVSAATGPYRCKISGKEFRACSGLPGSEHW